MGAFTKLCYHIVFGTKFRHSVITPDLKPRLYEYIGGTIRGINGHLIEIGGVEDHVHLLTSIPPTLPLSDAIRDIKANASKWINDSSLTPARFEWQKGYGAFTVSFSQLDSLRKYLRGQEEHHKTHTFEEEYAALLKRHEISFDPKHLFEGEHLG